MTKTRLRVEGMACNGCRTKVEKTLREYAGVTSADVDLKSKEAVITGVADAAELVQAVEKLGFTATIIR
ncbi:MAG: heavy-metal-associated domain-containing protein [Pelosinus sp.]|nr:heavy-metal-associated domain-containing protein [Pelosinus sp.]